MIGQISIFHQETRGFEHRHLVGVQRRGGGDNPRPTNFVQGSRAARNKCRSLISFALASLFMLYSNVPALNSRELRRILVLKRTPVPAAEVGVASWYGHPYHGRHAANGEVYNMHKLTAAHRTLPFGTRVLVRNLKNARTVEVRITDRGPFVDGRIIDLSRAAAGALKMRGAGLALVRLEVLPVVTAMNGSTKPSKAAAQNPFDLPRSVAR